MARLKFGFHTSSTGVGVDKDFYIGLNNAGIPFFAKGSDSLPFDAQTIAKTSTLPHVVVYRKATGNAPSGNPDVPDYNKTPKLAAQEHWAWHKSQLPPELDKAVTWIETVNEVDKNRAEWLAEFAIETAKLTMTAGYKWLAFGWSTGEPEPAHWQGVKMRQFLDMVAQNPDKLGIAVHEYSLDVNQINVPYLMGRYKNILDVNPNVNIYVTEWGWTYNAAPSVTKAMADITAIADVYNHPRLKGCAIWALNGGWGNIAQTVKTYITPLKELTLNTVLPDPSETGAFNYSFENGWTDVAPAPDRLQQPHDWQLTVLEPGEPIWGNNGVTGTPSIVTGIPECIHKHNNQLPPNQQFGGSDALILDGNYVYKIQAVHMVCGVELSTTITGLSPDTNYNVTVPTQVHYQNDYPDPEPDDIEIWINDSHYLAEILPDREWLPLETIVTSNSAGSAVLNIRFMTKWGNSRDMFIDNITLYEVETPPTTPGLGYKSIPVLLPQNATLGEMIDVRTSEFANRRTITQSHDEVIQLVKLGKAGSYAIIYDIHRWPVENQQQLLAIPHELRTLTPTPVKLTLPVLYSQRNTAWASKCIGVCPNDKTIGNWGCLLTAYNMLAQYLGLTTKNPGAYNDYMLSQGCFSGPYLKAGAFSMAHSNVTYHGYLERGDALNAKIVDWIDRAIPVPVRVDFNPQTPQWDQHWVLVVGYTDNDFIVADPWYGDEVLLSERYNITGGDALEGLFYSFDDIDTVDMLSFMRADPLAWRVVRHADGSQEDFRDYHYDNSRWAMVKNSQAEWWHTDGNYIYLTKDNSPAPASDGTQRFYTVNPGKWCKTHQALNETYIDGGHTVQFYNKATCQPHPENSGAASNNTTVLSLRTNYTFNSYGQNLTLDEVLFVKGNTEIQIFARHQGKALGRVGWISDWGKSEIVELHFDRGALATPPTEPCV